ncbi:MAG: diaminopimelate epimerase [Pseudomonadota bacterium]
MQIAFTKMQATGNDFIVIDGRDDPITLTSDHARGLADRRRGIGCDQIMLLSPPARSDTHFDYRIFNTDGSVAQQCGNGARAVALFAQQHGLVADEIKMGSPAGVVRAQVQADGVQVDMGRARFDAAAIPIDAPTTQPEYTLRINDKPVTFGAVSMGNPHAVLTVDDVDTEDLQNTGSALQRHTFFPEGVNVGFMQVIDRAHIRLRVFERGVGETLACGTGACAAVAIGHQRGQLDNAVTVTLPGGRLVIDLSGREDTVWLTGPANVVYEGIIRL